MCSPGLDGGKCVVREPLSGRARYSDFPPKTKFENLMDLIWRYVRYVVPNTRTTNFYKNCSTPPTCFIAIQNQQLAKRTPDWHKMTCFGVVFCHLPPTVDDTTRLARVICFWYTFYMLFVRASKHANIRRFAPRNAKKEFLPQFWEFSIILESGILVENLTRVRRFHDRLHQ